MLVGEELVNKPGDLPPSGGLFGEGNLTVNYIPGSPTDLLLREMHETGAVRAFRDITNEEVGEDMVKVEGFLYIRSRSKSRPIGDRMQVTYGVRFTGATTEAPYTPAP